MIFYCRTTAFPHHPLQLAPSLMLWTIYGLTLLKILPLPIRLIGMPSMATPLIISNNTGVMILGIFTKAGSYQIGVRLPILLHRRFPSLPAISSGSCPRHGPPYPLC